MKAKIISILFLSMLSVCYAKAQKNALNVPLLLQLVENSKTEYKKQGDIKKQQTKNSAVEEGNRQLLGNVKEKYRTLQQRFAKLGIVFDAVNIGITATPLVKEIIAQQQRIIYLSQSDPILIPVAIDSEILFVKRANSLANYLIGLVAVIGDVNQMKVVDRRLLFEHVLNELRTISYMSSRVVSSMVAQKRRFSNSSPFGDYINREEALVNDIINNVKILKE